MKQLKFMLAAATAISLATAAQAALSDGPTSQNFDGWTVGAGVPGSDDNGFSYFATDNGNSSVIYQNAEDADNNTKVLNVDTSGQPLLYNIQSTTNGLPEDLSAEGTKSVVIETDVKFTVTAADQTVTADLNSDKLMIYLKQFDAVKDDGDTVLTPATTKLMVKAALYTKADGWVIEKDTFTPTDVVVNNVSVTPNAWYHLRVESFVTNGVTAFKIKLGETYLISETALFGEDKTVFPSLVQNSTIKYVGFAGEGYVDNIVVTKEVNTPSTVDFTFAWTTDGISAVKYAIGAVTAETTFTLLPADTKKITGLNATDNITIQIVPTAWWAVKDDADLTYTANEEEAELDDFVTKLASVGEDGTVAVESTTTPAALNINEGSFVNETAGSTELAKVVKWATSKGGATAANIGTVVGALNFEDGDEETPAEKAYLFNCSINDVDAEVANFKFPAFTPGTKPAVNTPLHGGEYNGQLKYYGADTLEGLANKVEAADEHKFFKAVLTK